MCVLACMGEAGGRWPQDINARFQLETMLMKTTFEGNGPFWRAPEGFREKKPPTFSFSWKPQFSIVGEKNIAGDVSGKGEKGALGCCL